MNPKPDRVIDAEGVHYRELNERIIAAVEEGTQRLLIRNVRGQRYIGAALGGSVEMTIEGVPGNDLACFMDGPRITVQGNSQDGVGNTMGNGEVVVHGHAGDVLGYGMRGGRILVKGDAGYRVGIHMKEFKESVPVIVVGGRVKDYFGEYMAGGLLVLLGLGANGDKPLAGDFLGTGMHGGDIYIRGHVEPWQLGAEVGRVDIDDKSWGQVAPSLEAFSARFGVDRDELNRERFTRLRPVTHRPYGRIYVY